MVASPPASRLHHHAYVVQDQEATRQFEFTVDAANAAELDERQRATAHDQLRRWLDGDHRPNNDVRSS